MNIDDKKELIDKITKYIIYIFKDCLQEFKYILEKRDSYNLASECISIQFYFNEKINTFYLCYELNNLMTHSEDNSKAITIINSRLLNSFKMQTGYNIEIVYPDITKLGTMDIKFKFPVTEIPYIDQYTFSYWRTLNDNYQFLSGLQGIRLCPTYYHPEDFYIGNENGSRINRDNFLKELVELNKEYNLNNNFVFENEEEIKEVFEKYNDIYFKYYNTRFSCIKTEDIVKIYLDVFIDNSLLEHFTGDGILASTATGSTAYNMSFGGSIVYNSLNTLSIVPIAPISNKVYHTLMVPIIVPNNNIVSFVPSKENQSLEFKIDGENKCINKVLRIDTLVSDNYIKCIRMNDFHFIKVVNDKIIGN